ncbi:hypothetical protein PSACC_01248 [Paramicrosporidium saccamoebae]|uniref:Transcription initiation factor TFIID subunit 2 n=1 Tax=Paramicrosporidium saccamoebae TaxID=1246581 RepID=A0A2H9TMH0_9FUNG|nr:hypothetical protein PSACC_01248 [Paramicrosporidium saccamoebae]
MTKVEWKVTLRIHPVEKGVSAVSDIRIQCTDSSLTTLSLHARCIDIQTVSIDGNAAEYTLERVALDTLVPEGVTVGAPSELIQYPNRLRQEILNSRDRSELKVTLPTVRAGEEIVLRIEYEMKLSFLARMDGEETRYFQVHATGMDGMGRHWLPCFEDDPILWDFEYRISTDKIPSLLATQNIHVASSGALCQQFFLPEENTKVLQFKLDVLTPPRNVGFVAGIFEMVRVPAAPFAAAFCPLGMAAKLTLSVEFLSRAFGYINWYLTTTFPYPSYYCVFLREAFAASESASVANISLFSTLALFNNTIIDQTLKTRSLISAALAEQYFGVRLRAEGSASRWLTQGISGFLARHMLRIFHGNNDFRYNLKKAMATLLAVDTGHGPIVDAPDVFANPADEDWLRLKSCLTMIVFEHRLEKGALQKVSASCPLIGTGVFLKLAKKISGKDMRSFADQWIFSAGCPVFSCTFSFNRKRSTIEVDVKQSTPNHPQRKVAGTLLIRVHEVDGVFDHSVHIDDFSHHFELPVHAKAKKIKKKKRLLMPDQPEPAVDTKEEEEDTFVSPLSWIRLDPEMEWIASLELHQPDFMLVEQLQNDRDVIAQHEAIESLCRQPSDTVIEALERILNDPKCFYRIRIEAAEGLAGCAPNPETHLGGLKLISFYNKGFALQSLETVVVPVPKTNNFEALQSYFIQSSLAGAMAKIRTKNGTLMELVGQILLNMLRFNDNAGNMYSDNYYVVSLLRAMLEHLRVRRETDLPTERLLREFVKELDRYAIVEKIQPYYHNTVMVTILDVWRELRLMGMTHSTAIVCPEVLLKEGNFVSVRLAALEYLLSTEELLSDSICESLQSLLTGNRGIRAATLDRLLRITPKSISCRTDFNAKKEFLLDLLSQMDLAYVSQSVQYLYFVGRLIETATLDRPTESGRISLRIALPVEHELSSADEHVGTVGEEEPDWYLEVGGEQGSRVRPSVTPKLRLAMPDSSPTGKLAAVVQGIWSNFDSFPFRYPVDPSVVGYYDVIKNPVDLSTIQDRLRKDIISSVAQLCEDLRLMFDNCFLFNLPESLIYEQAKRLRSHALKEFRRVFPLQFKEIRAVLMTKEPVVIIPDIIADVVPDVVARPPKVPKTPELSLTERMERVLEKTRSHPYAFWFLTPVDPVALNIPTYPEIVTEPMDLGTLEQRLRAGDFADNPREFVRLLDIIFVNCTTFNPVNTVVHQNALQMRTAAQKLVKKLLPETTTTESVPKLKLTLSPKKSAETGGLKLKLTLPPRDDSWYASAQKILDQVSAHEFAIPFLQPVDPVLLNLPSYPRIIKNPMDLSTIRAKLSSASYTRATEMHRDFKLMFSNCYRFNGRTAPISEAAKILESFYDSLYLQCIHGVSDE